MKGQWWGWNTRSLWQPPCLALGRVNHWVAEVPRSPQTACWKQTWQGSLPVRASSRPACRHTEPNLLLREWLHCIIWDFIQHAPIRGDCLIMLFWTDGVRRQVFPFLKINPRQFSIDYALNLETHLFICSPPCSQVSGTTEKKPVRCPVPHHLASIVQIHLQINVIITLVITIHVVPVRSKSSLLGPPTWALENQYHLKRGPRSTLITFVKINLKVLFTTLSNSQL